MRPRPDAAENRDVLNRGVRQSRVASMRPRPDAAENPFTIGPASLLTTAPLQ